MSTRLALLIAHAGAARTRRFRYGRHDCALFAAGWVRLVTGRDLTPGWRYTSLRDGRAQLLAAGHADHIALAAAHLPEIAPARAGIGDLAVVGRALGIVAGETIYVLQSRGLASLPLTAASRAFRV